MRIDNNQNISFKANIEFVNEINKHNPLFKPVTKRINRYFKTEDINATIETSKNHYRIALKYTPQNKIKNIGSFETLRLSFDVCDEITKKNIKEITTWLQQQKKWFNNIKKQEKLHASQEIQTKPKLSEEKSLFKRIFSFLG